MSIQTHTLRNSNGIMERFIPHLNISSTTHKALQYYLGETAQVVYGYYSLKYTYWKKKYLKHQNDSRATATIAYYTQIIRK